jgi:uncharacterized cupredoxin-like copper-binding protein
MPTSRSSLTRRVLGLVPAALLAVACSSGASPSAPPPASTTPSTAAGGSAGAAVTAKETEFKIELGAATAAAGSVTFQISNAGTIVHEFVVVRTDLAADKLPVDGTKGEVNEDDPALTAVDEVEDIAVAAPASLTVALPAGHYVVFCNVPAHYTAGMHADFTTN